MANQHERITRLIADQLGIEESQVTPDKNITADLGADSLDEIEMVMQLEDEFEISIDDHRAEQVGTVADAFALVAHYAPE